MVGKEEGWDPGNGLLSHERGHRANYSFAFNCHRFFNVCAHVQVCMCVGVWCAFACVCGG